MGDVLFRRAYAVTLDTIRITDLDLTFAIHRSLKPEPNTCEIKVYNLNPDHRQALEEKPEIPVMVEAGYVDTTCVLFLGKLRTSLSITDGPDIITTIASGDGEAEIRKSRVNVSIAKNTPTDQVLKQIAKALGVGPGNLDKATIALKSSAISTMFSEGTVISGNAGREMTRICQSLGLDWSVQNGALQILQRKASLEGSAIKLDRKSGLIGSPTVDAKGVVKMRSLLIPDLFPGRKIVLDSERLKGQYRAEAVTYTGDTAGQDWYADIEAKRY